MTDVDPRTVDIIDTAFAAAAALGGDAASEPSQSDRLQADNIRRTVREAEEKAAPNIHDVIAGMVRKWTHGVARIEWIVDRGVRNEPLDCRVYAAAALAGLGAAGFNLSDAKARIANAPSRAHSESHNEHKATQPTVIRSRWLDG